LVDLEIADTPTNGSCQLALASHVIRPLLSKLLRVIALRISLVDVEVEQPLIAIEHVASGGVLPESVEKHVIEAVLIDRLLFDSQVLEHGIRNLDGELHNDLLLEKILVFSVSEGLENRASFFQFELVSNGKLEHEVLLGIVAGTTSPHAKLFQLAEHVMLVNQILDRIVLTNGLNQDAIAVGGAIAALVDSENLVHGCFSKFVWELIDAHI
jgi:hypothetical protein